MRDVFWIGFWVDWMEWLRVIDLSMECVCKKGLILQKLRCSANENSHLLRNTIDWNESISFFFIWYLSIFLTEWFAQWIELEIMEYNTWWMDSPSIVNFKNCVFGVSKDCIALFCFFHFSSWRLEFSILLMNLTGNGITNKGALYIAPLLLTHNSILRLDLSGKWKGEDMERVWMDCELEMKVDEQVFFGWLFGELFFCLFFSFVLDLISFYWIGLVWVENEAVVLFGFYVLHCCLFVCFDSFDFSFLLLSLFHFPPDPNRFEPFLHFFSGFVDGFLFVFSFFFLFLFIFPFLTFDFIANRIGRDGGEAILTNLLINSSLTTIICK